MPKSSKTKIQRKVAHSFVFYILLFSSFTALISTTIQLFFEYKRDISTIEKTAAQIESSHKSTITQALWAYDIIILESQLNGIKELPGVFYASIHKDNQILMETGPRHLNGNFLPYQYPLLHHTKNQQLKLGTLVVKISLVEVYKRLWDRVIVILLTQTLKTFFVSIFIFFLFYFIVGRHLKKMADFAGSIHLDNLDQQLVLRRKKGGDNKPDELGLVESALNKMRLKLLDEINKVRKSQEALKKSEERFQLAMQFANDGLYDWNLETNEIYYSSGWKKILGYEDHEIMNKVSEWIRQTEPGDVKDSWKMLKELLGGKLARFEKEIKMRHKEGHWVDILSRANVIFNEEGKGIRLLGTHVDISERKKAEKEIIEQKRIAERYLNLSGVMFIGLDGNGDVNIANKKACSILECDENEIMGLNWFDHFIPATIRNEVRTVFEQLMNGEVDPVEYYENPIITKSGMERQIAWHNASITDDDNKTIGLLGSGEDITEKRKLQEQLHQAQKMESIGNLAGGIAHDFNNILSSVIGYTELALDEVEKKSTVESKLLEVIAAGLRAKDLVKQILAFARKSEEQKKPIQPSIIAKEVIKFIRSSIPTTIEIKTNIQSRSFVMGNPTQIHQILMNLSTNAAHAMEENGGILEIRIEDIYLAHASYQDNVYLKPGDYIQFKVSDTGKGIAPEILNSIFEPYYTTKKFGEGTGMGLAMVEGIVETYGGKIAVDSFPGNGSTFTVYLPITKNRDAHQSYAPEHLPSGTEKILLVDDEAPIAGMGKRMLEQLGYSVETRTSSVAALELFRSNPDAFNLVISDMTMPNLPGDKLAFELMKLRSDIPIILCTGYSKNISDVIASEMGIKALAYKPIVKADLAKTVRKVLDEAMGSTNKD